jgi:hypothetical protein
MRDLLALDRLSLASWRDVYREVVEDMNSTPSPTTGNFAPNDITEKNLHLALDPTVLMNQYYGIPPPHPAHRLRFNWTFEM